MPTLRQAGSKIKGRRKKKRLNALKSFFGSPQKRGVIQLSRIMTPKKPNSAKRKVARIRLSNKYKVTAKIKGRSGFLNKHANVLVCGGRANDLPGVRYNMIKGKLDFSWREKVWRMNSRSKYGIKLDDYCWIVNEYLEKLKAQDEDQE